MVQRLAPYCRSAVVTEVLPPRGAAAARVAAAFPAGCPATAEPDVARAWQRVRERAGHDGVVVAAGSLFLIGELTRLGIGRPAHSGTMQGAART